MNDFNTMRFLKRFNLTNLSVYLYLTIFIYLFFSTSLETSFYVSIDVLWFILFFVPLIRRAIVSTQRNSPAGKKKNRSAPALRAGITGITARPAGRRHNLDSFLDLTDFESTADLSLPLNK